MLHSLLSLELFGHKMLHLHLHVVECSQLARTHLQINDPETNRFVIQLLNPTTYSEVCNNARTTF